MTEFKMTLAYRPEKRILLQIQEWLKRELRNPPKLKIKVDPKIIGGAVIEFKGRYKDFSMRKMLEIS